MSSNAGDTVPINLVLAEAIGFRQAVAIALLLRAMQSSKWRARVCDGRKFVHFPAWAMAQYGHMPRRMAARILEDLLRAGLVTRLRVSGQRFDGGDWYWLDADAVGASAGGSLLAATPRARHRARTKAKAAAPLFEVAESIESTIQHQLGEQGCGE